MRIRTLHEREQGKDVLAAYIHWITQYGEDEKLRDRAEHSASYFGTNQKLICDFLLVISFNTNLHPILHRFQVMADYQSNFR